MSFNGQRWQVSATDDARKNLPPPKRDFQEANPPKNLEDLYSRYDPSVGAGIAIALGSLLVYLLAKVAIRFVCKNIKRYLQKTNKTFCKYFPEEKLPPLHVVQQLAVEHGIEIPEDVLLKLSSKDDDYNSADMLSSKQIKNSSMSNKRSSTKTTILSPTPTTPAKSPDDIFFNKACQSCVKEKDYIFNNNSKSPGYITVNIIGATPSSITPNPCHKPCCIIPNHHHRLASLSEEGNKDFTTDPMVPGPAGAVYPNLLVTTATIEKFPLLPDDLIKSSSNNVTTNVPSCSKCCSAVSGKYNATEEKFNCSNYFITNETVL